MNIRITTILFFTILSCSFSSFSQNKSVSTINLKSNDEDFSVSFSMYNHAEKLSKGILNYTIKNNILTITRSRDFSKKVENIFYKEIDTRLIDEINTLNLDTLKDIYINWCIMVTSGNEYHVNFKKGATIKKIYLHCYYHKQIDHLVILINKFVPEEYKIRYMSPDNVQNCEIE